MASSDATITGNIFDALGIAYQARRAKVWVEFNTENKRVTDDEGAIRLGAGEATIDDKGNVTIPGIPVPSGASNPAAFQVKIHYDISPRVPASRGVQRERGDFGWMTVTGNTTLSALEEEFYAPPEYVGQFRDLLDQAEALTGIDDSDAAQAYNIANGPATKAALGGYVDFKTSGTGATGVYKNDATTKPALTIGNAPGSAGFPGTGSPPKALGALAIYQKFGNSAGDGTVPVPNTTQAAYLLANYYAPTADDSMEAFSTYVGVKAVSAPYTQTKPVTSFEAIAACEGANQINGGAYLMSVGARSIVTGTSHVTDAYGFRATVNSSGGPTFGTIDRYIAFYQPVSASANGGTVTAKYGVYVVDPIVGETSVTVGDGSWTGQASIKKAGNGDSAVSLMVLKGPDSLPGDPSPRGLTTLSLVAAANQTRSMLEARDLGGTTRFQIGVSGNVVMRGQTFNVADSSGNSKVLLGTTGITLADAVDVIAGTTTGSKIGTGTNQKLGFWGQTPVVRQTLPASGVVTAADIRSLLITIGLAA